ncbi:MAG: pseudouridine synthase [Proteobacteria bacterium]|nr:pseudouridine synthase [Pseudomonadota bacterium]
MTTSYIPPAHTDALFLYQDPALLVLNKPSGLLSVPGRGDDKADCAASRAQTQFSDSLIVHRLDMSTSGIMVMARGLDAQRALSRSFELRSTEKRYIAVVDGRLEGEGEVNLPLITDWPNRPRQKVDHDIGKPSLTRWKALDYDAALDATRVELTPVTGRTHQLRLHMLALGHPILGDDLYATPHALAKAERLLLHACFLSIPHPLTQQQLAFTCAAPF